MVSFKRNFISRLFSLIPVLILLFLSFSGIDFNFEKLSFLSFNLIYILIFYWVLKNPDILGYGFIFLAGIVNDVVSGLPIGVSSVTYLILAGFAAYIRHLTVQPSLIYDWIVFVPSIAVTNSVYFYILGMFFDIEINYISLALNTGVTILFYPVIGILFSFLANKLLRKKMFDRDAFGVNKNKLITRRMFVLSVAKVIVFTGIIGRLFSLQISENKKYSFLSDKNRLKAWKLPPKRGIFEDYFGNTIADNNQVFQLHVVPEEVEDFNYLMVRLKNIIKIENKEIRRIYKKKEKQLPWETLIISENLSWEEFSKLNLFLHELPGAKPVFSVARQYPQAENFTHVLGYVAEASPHDINNYPFIKENHVPGLRVGKTGLEKALEKELIGASGLQRYEVNAHGKKINEIDRVEGIQGKKFRITIDQEVQNYVQKLLTGKSGSISVMDIYTGRYDCDGIFSKF